jgi:transposase-like protein
MDTSVVVESPGRRTHRRHSAEFKAQVILACRQPGVSVASVALANGLNANMLRRWVLDAERTDAMACSGQGVVGVGALAATSSLPAFVAVQMASAPSSSTEPDIYIELKRGPTTIIMRWPAGLASACASCLRELLR